jgi:bifunctional UDP-N-acetylglucosamine pyrophosphorylase/glucosamine-1-phosphate N-acetyltransferase
MRQSISIIMAAGRGSRMMGYNGNKTLLPLRPAASPYQGSCPILLNIISRLPPGPKALVVNYKKESIIEATRSLDLTYWEQPQLNGTGGAILAAAEFIETQEMDPVIITMGDVPFVKTETYFSLIEQLRKSPFVVLGFRPKDQKQYGLIEIRKESVLRIIEWKYWKDYPKKKQNRLQIANSGIYAARRKNLSNYLNILKKKPHIVMKERDGLMTEVEEYFITDLIEIMTNDGLGVGYVVAEDEYEVMGIDDLQALKKAQALFRVTTV